MDHHLKHALISDINNIRRYCQDINWLDISKRVEKGIQQPEFYNGIKKLVDSTVNNKPIYFINDKERKDQPLVSMQEYDPKEKKFNKNSMLIKNKIDGKIYMLDCLDYPFRKHVPNFSDNLPLGTIVSGIYHQNIIKGQETYKKYIKYSLKELSKSLLWFNNSVIENLDSGKEHERKFFKKDLEELNRILKPVQSVAFFDLQNNFSELQNSIKRLINIDIIDNSNFKESNEYKTFNNSLNKTIKLFDNVDINKKHQLNNKRKTKP